MGMQSNHDCGSKGEAWGVEAPALAERRGAMIRLKI